MVDWSLWRKWFVIINSIKFHIENEWPRPSLLKVWIFSLVFWVPIMSYCNCFIHCNFEFELTFMWLPEVNIVLTCLGPEPASELLHCSLRVLVQIMNGNLHKCSIMLYIDNSFDALTILYCTVLLLLSGIIKNTPALYKRRSKFKSLLYNLTN